MRREIPTAIAFFIGVVCIFQFFIPHWPFGTLVDTFSVWFQILQSFAIWLGALNLIKVSLEKSLDKRTHDRWYGWVVMAAFSLIFVVGMFFSGGRQFQEPGSEFDYLYRHLFTPLSSTMFALLAFYVASASYRAFRARTREATLLLVAAFIVMLGRAPIGDQLIAFVPEGYRLSDMASWIMTYPQIAGQRAIMIGIALGIISASMRLILGLERSYLGSE
jgi:hypothetical protein